MYVPLSSQVGFRVKYLCCVSWQLHLTEGGRSRGMRGEQGNDIEAGLQKVMTFDPMEVTLSHHRRGMAGKGNGVEIQGNQSLHLPKSFRAETKGERKAFFPETLNFLRQRTWSCLCQMTASKCFN